MALQRPPGRQGEGPRHDQDAGNGGKVGAPIAAATAAFYRPEKYIYVLIVGVVAAKGVVAIAVAVVVVTAADVTGAEPFVITQNA